MNHDVDALLRREGRASLSLARQLLIYLNPFSLFKDASRGNAFVRQAAPEADPMGLAPQDLHRRRGVPGAERRAPAVVGHRNTRSVKVIWPSRSR